VRLNGLFVVIEMAQRALRHPLIDRYREALLLGSLREDVWYLPVVGEVIEHLSFSHFYKPTLPGGFIPLLWPGPRFKGELFHGRALRAFRSGDRAGAFVQLGRVAHLLTDMCCPVHAHRTPHWTDPYEWYIEANKAKLLALPVPQVDDADSAAALIERMARYTQRHRTDSTHHHAGAVLKKLGLIEGVSSREAGEQARDLIPVCAGHTVALFRLFLGQVGELGEQAGSPSGPAVGQAPSPAA
jgi:hypothetical protein